MSAEPLLAPPLPADAPDRIDTPALVVDLDRMDAAIVRMAGVMAGRGVALRPHAKTHKSLHVGRLQVAAGASGRGVSGSMHRLHRRTR